MTPIPAPRRSTSACSSRPQATLTRTLRPCLPRPRSAHRAWWGARPNGRSCWNAGRRPLFTPLAAAAGAATAIAVDPALIADPDRLATAAAGAGPGDNRGALALLALRDQRVASGGTQTLSDAALDLVGSLGRRAHDAQAETDRATIISDHLGDLRDALSGVDLDEEMSNLVKFQHGAEAMTRFLSTVDGMLGDLLNRL